MNRDRWMAAVLALSYAALTAAVAALYAGQLAA